MWPWQTAAKVANLECPPMHVDAVVTRIRTGVRFPPSPPFYSGLENINLHFLIHQETNIFNRILISLPPMRHNRYMLYLDGEVFNEKIHTKFYTDSCSTTIF